MIEELFIVVTYVIFNWILWRKMKERFRWWFELMLRLFLPAGVASAWLLVGGEYYILAIIPAALILIYIFNYSEFFLMDEFSGIGERLLILNFHNDLIYNEVNVYIDTTSGPADVSQLLQENLEKTESEDLREIKKLIQEMQGLVVLPIYISLCDFVGDDFVRFCKIYYLKRVDKKQETQKKQRNNDKVETIETVIPKVLTLNCVRLKDEEVKDRKFVVVLGIEGQRDDELLKHLARLKFAMEGIKVFPRWYEIELLKEELEAKEATIQDMWRRLKKLKDEKTYFDTRVTELEGRRKRK